MGGLNDDDGDDEYEYDVNDVSNWTNCKAGIEHECDYWKGWLVNRFQCWYLLKCLLLCSLKQVGERITLLRRKRKDAELMKESFHFHVPLVLIQWKEKKTSAVVVLIVTRWGVNHRWILCNDEGKNEREREKERERKREKEGIK